MISHSLPEARADKLFQALQAVADHCWRGDGYDDVAERETLIHGWYVELWLQSIQEFRVLVRWRGDVQRLELHPRQLPPEYLTVLREHIQELDWLLDS